MSMWLSLRSFLFLFLSTMPLKISGHKIQECSDWVEQLHSFRHDQKQNVESTPKFILSIFCGDLQTNGRDDSRHNFVRNSRIDATSKNWIECWFSTMHEIKWREITKIIINCNRNMSKNWMRLRMGILFSTSRLAIALNSLSSLQIKEGKKTENRNITDLKRRLRRRKKATQTTKALHDDVTRLRKVFSPFLTLLSHLSHLHYRSGLSDHLLASTHLPPSRFVVKIIYQRNSTDNDGTHLHTFFTAHFSTRRRSKHISHFIRKIQNGKKDWKIESKTLFLYIDGLYLSLKNDSCRLSNAKRRN